MLTETSRTEHQHIRFFCSLSHFHRYFNSIQSLPNPISKLSSVMQITSIFAALLLAGPALVTAAPVANDNSVSAVNDVFARYEATCNPQFSTDPAKRREQEAAAKRMRDLTKEYKAAERKCPKTAAADFAKKSTNKQTKEKLKRDCIAGWTECVEKRLCFIIRQRLTALQVCEEAGGGQQGVRRLWRQD